MPSLQKAAALPVQNIKVRRVVRPQPAPQYEQMAACHDIGRVELQAAQVSDDVHNASGIGWRAGDQPIAGA